MMRRIFVAAFLVVVVCCVMGCATHVMTEKEGLSRTHTYISFANNKQPYSYTGEVGGEHMAHTKIVAFSQERYLVEVVSQAEGMNLSIQGEGITVDGQGLKQTVSVGEIQETFIDIALTAHPSGRYSLKIIQLPNL